jgi:hypothetical protein
MNDKTRMLKEQAIEYKDIGSNDALGPREEGASHPSRLMEAVSEIMEHFTILTAKGTGFSSCGNPAFHMEINKGPGTRTGS